MSKKISGQFVPHSPEMLGSPAFRALSQAGHKILARIEIEHCRHGGKENGKLPVTFADLEEYGISDRHTIGAGIREVCALGFNELTRRGRSGNGEYRTPNLFRITYLPANGAPPTNEWRGIKTPAEAKQIARNAKQPAKIRRPKKTFPSGGNHTGTGVETTPLAGPKTAISPVVETTPLSRKDLAILGLGREGSKSSEGCEHQQFANGVRRRRLDPRRRDRSQ